MNSLKLFAADITNPCDEFPNLDGCPKGGNESNLIDLVSNIVTWLTIAIGILSVVFIIISAIQIMTSSGDADKVKRGQRTLLYSVIGLVVAIMADVIISIVFNVAGSF